VVDAVIVDVTEVPGLTLTVAGLSETVRPAACGDTVAARLRLPVNPFTLDNVIDEVKVDPAGTARAWPPVTV
jgi:hypothetical protein